MNCLLLLIILFCSGGNSVSSCGCSNPCNRRGHVECNRPCGSNSRPGCNNSCGVNSRPGCNNNCGVSHSPGCNLRSEIREERQTARRDCECDVVNVTSSSTTSRGTQFPYLDVEPCTCGCEERTES